ncbi:uncharacterized protein VP01_910g3, partial [Puccinia sorghi]
MAGGLRFECRKGNLVLCCGKTLDNLLFIDLNPLQAILPYLKKVFPNLKINNLECVDCDRAKMHRQP